MALESVLAELEGGSRRFRDPANYAFVVFGEPGVAPWGWRLIFLINVPIAATVILLSRRYIPESRDEAATGPLMFQGDHGPVAFRNIKITPTSK